MRTDWEWRHCGRGPVAARTAPLDSPSGSDACWRKHVAYAEKRGRRWRARWRGPDGTLESKPGFQTRKAAEDFGRDQEATVRANTYIDPRAGRITLTDWVNQWYPSLDLELTTLANYRYLIEVHILPVFGDRLLTMRSRATSRPTRHSADAARAARVNCASSGSRRRPKRGQPP